MKALMSVTTAVPIAQVLKLEPFLQIPINA